MMSLRCGRTEVKSRSCDAMPCNAMHQSSENRGPGGGDLDLAAHTLFRVVEYSF